MVRQVVHDPILLGMKSEPATPEDLPIARDLLDTLVANKDGCVGMAANMIGVNKRIAAVSSGKSSFVLINPVITAHSEETYQASESCLSLEGKRYAERYEWILVEYYDIKFKKQKQKFSGFTAQIIQHETDHFEGKVI